MRASEIQPKKLVVFDIDDTLVHTQTKVHVVKDGQIVASLNSHDFTHYKLQPGESFDFEDFRNAKEFFEKSRPIIPMMNQLKQDIATGNKVVMVTARADFDDRELFLNTFRKYDVDMSKVHVYRAGNSKQGSTEERKKAIIKTLLDNGNYTKAIMYDDAKPNLHTFIELKKDHPQTKFYAWHVSLQGDASEYMREEIIDERKKRKKKSKSRWAAYGPGPYGLYGVNTGYSGDGGVSGDGGGVGENFADSEVKDNEPSPEFVEAIENWQEMWNTDEAAKIILNSPESKPFRTPPSATKLYRAVVPKDRELNSIKANGSVVAFATKLDGAINFVQTLETMDEWVIIEKPFNPSGFLLDYTAMIEHYKLSDFDRYVDEAEVWMKPGPQYSGVKKSEVVLTSQQYYSESVNENFADGKNPGRKGLSKRVGIPKKSTLGQLEKIAGSSTGERRRMAQWQLNMRRGKKK